MSEIQYPLLKKHVFICTNEREQGHIRGCCFHKESMSLVELFKKELTKRKLRLEMRAQKAGCLDTCEWGPSLVVYPEGVWYGKVQPKDVEEIIDSHLIGGKIVERLLIPSKMKR